MRCRDGCRRAVDAGRLVVMVPNPPPSETPHGDDVDGPDSQPTQPFDPDQQPIEPIDLLIADEDEPDETDDTVDDHTLDDGVVVLPWWQHPLNIVTMLVSVALVAGMIGWLVSDASGESAGGEVDVGFLQDMREHHESAVGLSLLFLDIPDTRPGLRTVARTIVVGQSIEIGRMIQLLRDFGADEANLGDTSMTWMGMSAAVGSMPGIPTPAQVEQLASSSGEEADRLFVELMIAHHLGGLDMARFAAATAEDAEVRRFATAIMNAQEGEIVEMTRLLDP